MSDHYNDLRKKRYEMKYAMQDILPNNRICLCTNYAVKDSAEIWQSLETCRNFFSKIIRCGSVWICPLCSIKISEKRRNELENLYHRFKSLPHSKVSMITLTFQHSYNDDLKTIIKSMLDARRAFTSDNRYIKIHDKYNIIGSVRAFEITHGKNGFHPHLHVLMFYQSKKELYDEQKVLQNVWQMATKRFNLNVQKQIGLNVSSEREGYDYITKWGYELTRGHTKDVRSNKGRTPFQILSDYQQTKSEKDKKILLEYVSAIKGCRQLVYSKNLKLQFSIKDKTDQQLADEHTQKAKFISLIDSVFLTVLSKLKLQSKFLELTEIYDYDIAYQKINEIIKKIQSERTDCKRKKTII